MEYQPLAVCHVLHTCRHRRWADASVVQFLADWWWDRYLMMDDEPYGTCHGGNMISIVCWKSWGKTCKSCEISPAPLLTSAAVIGGHHLGRIMVEIMLKHRNQWNCLKWIMVRPCPPLGLGISNLTCTTSSWGLEEKPATNRSTVDPTRKVNGTQSPNVYCKALNKL